jgi:hypothetical protein
VVSPATAQLPGAVRLQFRDFRDWRAGIRFTGSIPDNATLVAAIEVSGMNVPLADVRVALHITHLRYDLKLSLP